MKNNVSLSSIFVKFCNIIESTSPKIMNSKYLFPKNTTMNRTAFMQIFKNLCQIEGFTKTKMHFSKVIIQ